MLKLNSRFLFIMVMILPLVTVFSQDQDGEVLEAEVQKTFKNQEVIDSLVLLLMNEHESPQKVVNYLKLSDLHKDQDHAEALRYSQEGLSLASRIGDMEGMLQCELSVAHIYMSYIVDFDKAISSYDEALELAVELDDRESEMLAYKGKSYVYGALGNFEAAEDYLGHALSIAEELDDTERISSYNGYLGGLYEENDQMDKAMLCYEKVVDIERSGKFQTTTDNSILVVAHYYFLKEDMDQAIHFYRIALKRFQRDQNYRWQSYTHSELARLHMKQGNFERAESHAINGLSLAQDFDLSKEISDNYLVLIDVADSLGKHELSDRYQKAYDTLASHLERDKELINSDITPAQLAANTASSKEEVKATEPAMNRFVNTLIIAFPVGLLLLLMAKPSKN